jgi:hypothetical protein
MSNYDIVDYRNEHHLEILLNWLMTEVRSSGGDGDAIWYSLFYDVRKILPIVEKLNKKVKWKIELKERQDGRYIVWGDNQECVIITNSETMWNQRPSWQQCSIQY